MNSAKRALVKLAIVGTLAGGVIGMPLVASAAPNDASGGNTCFGFFFTAGLAKEGITPPVKADFFGFNNAGEFNRSLRELCASN